MIYLLVYAGLLLCVLSSTKKRSSRITLYYLCLFGLFFFVGFRYRVGCDWGGYLLIFKDANRSDVSVRPVEFSFWELVKLVHYFELEYPYLNVIGSAVFFLGLHALAKRQPDPLSILTLAFPILILNLAMSGLRQAIALGFLCFAFNAFIDKRLLRMLVFVAIASTFHTSSTFFFMLAPFVRGEFSRRGIVYGTLLALPGLYYLLSAGTFDLYVSRYATGAGVEAAGAPFRTGLVALSAFVFLWFFDLRWKQRFTKDYKLVKLSSYIMLATFPVSFFSSVIGDRFGFYLNPIELMIIGRLPFLRQGMTPKVNTLGGLAPYAVGMAVLLADVGLSSLFEKCYLPYQMWGI